MAEIDDDFEQLFGNFRVEPSCIQIQLKQLRTMETPRYMKEFLESTQDLPGEAIAVLTAGKATILVDDKGRLLEFR